MLGAFVMVGGHCIRAAVTCRSSRAMHRAGHDGNRGTAQRRDPRREEDDGQIDGKEAAHHGCQSTAIESRRNARQKARAIR